MFVKTPSTATAMALVLGLAGPLPAAAQERPVCAPDAELPCVTDTGAVVETRDELDIYLERFPAEAEAAAGEGGAVEASSDPEAAAELPQCAEGAPVPCVTDTGAVVETEVELESWLDAFGGGAPAEGGNAAEPEAAAPAGEEAEAPASETAAEPVTEEAAPETAAEPAAEEAAPETAAEPVTEEAAPETAAEPVTEEAAPETAAEPAAEEAAPETAAEPVTEEAAPETAAEPVTEEAAPETAAEPAAEEAAPAEGATAPADADAAGGDAVAAPAEAPAEPAPPAAAAASAEDAAPSGEVEETTVTEDTVRSATEEFDTEIEASPAPAATEDDDEDDTLTTLQRVIAAGLAGAALGALTGDGGEVVANTGDRLVVRNPEGDLRVLRDENALLRQPGSRVRTETFDDGSTRTTVIREDGSEIVTIRAPDGRVLRRTRVLPDGVRVVLFDDTQAAAPVDVATLPAPRREAVAYTGDEAALRAALAAAMAEDLGRSFSLAQIREIREVRELAPEIEIDAITFASGSAAIRPDQAEELAVLGRTIVAMTRENPGEVFLVEGHTDAVGAATYNLALSDRRAETVALALTEFFDVPPENLVVQGYGESDLKVPTEGAEVANRRVNVRRITPLLAGEATASR